MSENRNEYQFQIDTSGKAEKELPTDVIIIPIVNSPIFPGMIAPIILSEDRFDSALDKGLMQEGHVGLNLVKMEGEDISEEDFDDEQDLTESDIFKVGVLCKVVKKIQLPDGTVNLLVHGIKRYRAEEVRKDKDGPLRGRVDVFEDILEADEELDAYTRSVINQVKKLSEINPYFNEEMKLAMLNSPSSGALADLVAFSLSLDVPEAQDFLETLVVKKRFAKLLIYLKREKNVADIQKKISDEVNDKVNKYQREYFLREQLKVIRNELGLEEDDKARDLKKIREDLELKKLPEDVLETVNAELERLEVIPDSSPEYNLARTYLQWIMDLPWSESSVEAVDIDKARKTLEKDHYGLERPKRRILEFLAVRKLRPQYDGTILCLLGPPGVGKTSLGKSIAESLGREFYRFSLGGMRDEAEIKGHRRTYVGAMPGRLIQALKRVKTNNPVIMLDEIDKLGQSFQGDPASALLEVLDPEQNSSFIDHYLDVPFDLSKVLFIATANYVGEIPGPLLDRMEVIDLSGYTQEEKATIASKWVIPKQLKKHGLLKADLKLPKATLARLIKDYARGPGVRSMEQFIAKLCRIAAFEKVSKKRFKGLVLAPDDLKGHLGGARFQSEELLKLRRPGIATGLAWTSYGGEVLTIETLPIRGKNGLKLTGQLGDVMNESASIAYSYVKQLFDEHDLVGAKEFLEKHEVHLHLPAGATPKDGPSAGITMALALYGLATGRPIKSAIGMTGELSLTGRVLPVGGIKEKVLGAKRAGIKTIILPQGNAKDLDEVPELHRKGIKFYPVEHFDEVLKIGLPSQGTRKKKK